VTSSKKKFEEFDAPARPERLLGMIDIHLTLEPHVGTPIVTRAETEAARLHRQARRNGSPEPFERHLADAYAGLLSGAAPVVRSRRPELVVLVSHEVIARGWKDVTEGEVCKIPGVGSVSPEVARSIAQDAFLTGVFYDGVDLRHLRRFTRNIPIEVLLALELGDPPDFDGIACTDCGKRFRTEIDHVEPHVAHGPASTANLQARCWSCHRAKTERDRKAGKLIPSDPGPQRRGDDRGAGGPGGALPSDAVRRRSTSSPICAVKSITRALNASDALTKPIEIGQRKVARCDERVGRLGKRIQKGADEPVHSALNC
jgi:5-methylcytosine-specific restriction endonuclease McrA